MPARIVVIAIVLLVAADTHADRDHSGDNWYFGSNGGVTFINGVPEPLAGGQINQPEGCATISDSDGNLLFYTDGIKVWNANHAEMPNGTGLLGNPSATQSAVVVPDPGDADRYYIFTVQATSPDDGFNYSVVDMTLDGGKGDVVVASKNTNLMAVCSEQVTASPHANGTDIWVIARPKGNNEFHAFLVTESGVETTPVVSNAGTACSAGGEVGYLKASPTGDKLAMAYYMGNTAEVYDFDSGTGAVSAAINLGTYGSGCYGIEFSQSGNVLYVTEFGTQLLQFDLTADDIPASKQVITGNKRSVSVSALQLAPDGKIYGSMSGQSKLAVIDQPELLGNDCGFTADGPTIAGACQFGLPTFIQSFFAAEAGFTINENESLEFVASDFTTPYNDATSNNLTEILITAVPTQGDLELDGVAVAKDDVILTADLGGLTYTPASNYFGSDILGWRGTNQMKGGGPTYDFAATWTIAIAITAQAPTVTAPTTDVVVGEMSDAFTVARAASDGDEIAYYQVTSITGGTLYKSDETTAISEGAYLTFAECAAGVHFKATAVGGSFTLTGAESPEAGANGDSKVVSVGAIGMPVVTSAAPSGIDSSSATLGGDVTSDGGTTITARGVCWSTSPAPTSDDTTKAASGTTGAFTVSVAELQPETTYYARAYATNKLGTAYGAEKTFTTTAAAIAPEPEPNDDPPAMPELEIEIEAEQEEVRVGETVTARVTLRNAGTGKATRVVLRIPIPADSEFVAAWLIAGATAQSTPLDATVDGDEVLISIGDVDAADDRAVGLEFRAHKSGMIEISANATSDEVSEPAAATTNATAQVDNRYFHVTQITPLCGPLGLLPVAMLFGMLTARVVRRRC